MLLWNLHPNEVTIPFNMHAVMLPLFLYMVVAVKLTQKEKYEPKEHTPGPYWGQRSVLPSHP